MFVSDVVVREISGDDHHAAPMRLAYIVSWNFKHIAGVTARRRITDHLRTLGFNQVTIHTPDELIEGVPYHAN